MSGESSGIELSQNVKDFHFFLPSRVHYADTDAQQVVYYGSFSRFFEAGRQEYWRRLGTHYPAHDPSVPTAGHAARLGRSVARPVLGLLR